MPRRSSRTYMFVSGLGALFKLVFWLIAGVVFMRMCSG